MSEVIKFNSNGVVKTVAVDRLVLKERDCTQTGTTYHLMEMGMLETNPENANHVTQISPEQFKKYHKKLPQAPVIRIASD